MMLYLMAYREDGVLCDSGTDYFLMGQQNHINIRCRILCCQKKPLTPLTPSSHPPHLSPDTDLLLLHPPLHPLTHRALQLYMRDTEQKARKQAPRVNETSVDNL